MFFMVRNSQYKSFRQGRIVMMHAFKVYSNTKLTCIIQWFTFQVIQNEAMMHVIHT